MSLTRSIAKNTILQLAGRVVGTIFGLLSVALLTRYLGLVGYGGFTTVTGFLQFFGILIDLGLTLTTVSMISQPNINESRLLGNLFSLRLVSGVIFFGLASIIVLFLPYSPEIKLGVAISSLAFLGMTQSQLMVGIFQKYLCMERAALAEVAGRAVLLIGIAIVVWQDLGFTATLWALVVGNAVQLLITFFSAQKIIPFKLLFEIKIFKEILRRSWPIGLSIAFNLVYLKGDVVILSLFRNQAEVGLYGAAYKVLDIITVIPMMFMGLVLPILAHAWSNKNTEIFRRRLQKAFDFSSIIALPIVGGSIVLGHQIMSFVAGQDFAASGNILQVLIFAALAVFFSGLYGHTIIAIGKQRASIWGYGIDALLSLAGYLIFVPKYGLVAAAWVTVFSESFIALFTLTLVARATKILPSLKTSIKALIATIIMMIVLKLIPQIHILILISIGFISYGALLIITKTISRNTLSELIPSFDSKQP